MTVFYWGAECLATFIEAVACFVLSAALIHCDLERRTRVWTRIVLCSIGITSIILVMNSFALFDIVNNVAGIILWIGGQYVVFQKRTPLFILIPPAGVVIMYAIDYVSARVIMMACDTSMEALVSEMSLERLLALALSKGLLILFTYLVYRYMRIRMYVLKRYVWIIAALAVVLITLDFFIMSRNSFTESRDMRIFSTVFFAASILLIIIMLFSAVKMSESYRQSQELALLRLQNDMILRAERDTSHVFELWRSSIHDYKNKIIAIKQWIDQGDFGAVEEFIEKEDALLAQTVFYIKTGNPAIDAVVNTKKSLAERKGIPFRVEAELPGACAISDMDLVCVLGNLIDNAIEASERQGRKGIEIVIKKQKQLLIIKVMNYFKETLEEEPRTTKQEKELHGIGIKNVKSIVKKYNGIYQMEAEDGEVVTTILFPES